MLADLRHALRSLLKTPGFTLVAVLTLAVGLGATTTIFSWVERVLLNPLPGTAEPARVVALETVAPSGELIDTSYLDYFDYARFSTSLSSILAFKERPLNLGTAEKARRVWAEMVTGNFFSTLGVSPQFGRFFSDADRADTPAAAPVAVLSDHLWRQQFAGDPKILGRTIKLNQQDYTVIGIAPAEFPGSLNGLSFDLWVPLRLAPQLTSSANWLDWRDSRGLHVLGRLAPHVTLEAARAELDALARRIADGDPKSNRGIGIALLPVAKSPHGAHSRLGLPLLILLGVCGLVLVIVGANLSNLLFVRASTRQREVCIRRALGAGRWRIIRQLLAESLLLAVAGGALGSLLSLWLSDLLRFLLPATDMPLALSGQLDLRVLAVAAALAAFTTVVAGLAPALWAARDDLVSVLRGGGRGSNVTPRAELIRGALVVAEVAVALVTLACAGLATKSFVEARRAQPGFRAEGVLLAAVKLDTSGYQREQGKAFIARLQDRLTTLPGVESAAIAEDVPLGLYGGSWEEIAAPGYAPAANENLKIYRNLVSPAYFNLMGIPVLHGREFLASDRADAPLVAIVNETFARRFLGGDNAVGRTFSIWNGSRALRVVGVVGDGKYHSLSEPAQPYFYLALDQFYRPNVGLTVHLRTAQDDPFTQLPALRRAVRDLDPNVPVFEALTLSDYISAARAAQRIAAQLLGILSVIAIVLAALGLYGVLSFAVAQRTPEIGVRLALGARPADIVRLIFRRGLMLVGLGLGAGLFASFAVGRLLARVLYGLHPSEPWLIVGVAALVMLAALVACWLPARRAAKVDPMVALRAE